MAYELRERRNNGVLANYYCSSDDEDRSGESDTFADPDYNGRGSSRRRVRVRVRNPVQSGEAPRQRRKLSAAASNQECSTSSRQPETEEKTVVAWMMYKGEIREEEAVKCEVNGVTKEGAVRAEGVLCRCCSILMNVFEFEIHAGSLSARPYENIIVMRTNSSLLQHLVKIWNKGGRTRTRLYNHVEPKPGAEDSSDDVCQICADGGDLMCCEQCPSTFHLGCIEMEAVPAEGWYCCYCKCKYCDTTCCYKNKLACVQCGRAFHWQCYGTREELDLNNDDLGLFCSSTCKEVAKKVRGMVGVKNIIKEGYTWSLIRRMEAVETEDDHRRMECNTKVALAFEVLNESFMTNIDNYTGINVLESVVNNRGSNLERVNFNGFYTLILEKNDAIISAATIRMHDNEVAEMPYIATRNKYRLRGMSRMIFDAVTYVLTYIGIKHLVIPALEEVTDMWQRKYGFSPINSEMKQKLINYNTLMFPGTIRLQKIFAGTSSAMEMDHNAARLATLGLTSGHY